MHPTRPRLQLLLVALLAVVSLLALVVARPAFGADPWSRGLDIAVIAAWVVAVAASAWLLVATAICVVALGIDRPAVARRLAPALPAHLRRLVEVAIAGSCIAFPALPALPAHAAGPAPVPTVVLADVPVVRAPVAPAARGPARRPSGRVRPRPSCGRATTSGSIARASLTRTSGDRADRTRGRALLAHRDRREPLDAAVGRSEPHLSRRDRHPAASDHGVVAQAVS